MLTVQLLLLWFSLLLLFQMPMRTTERTSAGG